MMMIRILQGTPGWVWGLLALLVILGLSQSMPRRVSARRIVIVPGRAILSLRWRPPRGRTAARDASR